MASERAKLLVAGSVLLVGGGVLLNAYLNSRPPSVPSVADEQEITQEVRNALNNSRFTELKVDERADVLERIRSAILSQARDIPRVRGLGEPSMRDLADAFAERVSSMYWPDFEHDFSASQLRGDPMPREEALRKFEKRRAFLDTQDWGPRVVFEGVEVTSLEIGADGELIVQRERFDAGFGVMTAKRSAHEFPLPDDPVENGYVAVEIVMPMYRYEVKSESMKPVVVGYRFAWNPRLNKWIPYESVVFKAPGEIFGAPSL